MQKGLAVKEESTEKSLWIRQKRQGCRPHPHFYLNFSRDDTYIGLVFFLCPTPAAMKLHELALFKGTVPPQK